MSKETDLLMEDIIFHEAYFQFNDEQPIKFAFVSEGELSITLKSDSTNNPEVEFSDGKGKSFKIFLKQQVTNA